MTLKVQAITYGTLMMCMFCWRDNSVVCVLTNEHPGHQDGTVKRSGKTPTGAIQSIDVPLPSAIKHYNQFMGGVDKSDQLIRYHRIIRQTKKYRKMLFYHLLEICITNAAVIHKWISVDNRTKLLTMNGFHDKVVLESSKTLPVTGALNSL